MSTAIISAFVAAADDGNQAFLGDDLLAWLLLALGGALVFGNVMALLRPPAKGRKADDLTRAPMGRSLLMMGAGLIATIWALATLTG
ncbi:MAG TPA: hypothetical protein VM121_12020 [Acidimicrobiales bacterium]|nr:hypothetical protein [Acidimicrobiales bacterium]